MYFVLIVAFTFFYVYVAFDPHQQADIIRKQGGFIPGIRPGPPTERYFAHILNRITVPGALFLASVAVVPSILMAAVEPQPVPLLRHDPAHLGRRGPRHHAPDRQPADDAQLRGLPQVGLVVPGVRLVVLGKQGAGKGTQCVRLSHHYVVPHVSTGDMLRAEVKSAHPARPAGQGADGPGRAGPRRPDHGDGRAAARPRATPGPGASSSTAARGPSPRPSSSADLLDARPARPGASTSRCPPPMVMHRLASRRVCVDCGANYSWPRRR